MPAHTGPGTFTGLEYTLSKDGGSWPENTDLTLTHGSPEPLTWQTIQMEFPDPTAVQGYNVRVRYFIATVDDITPPPPNPFNDSGPVYQLTVSYPAWNLISQDMQRNEERFYFENETGGNLFAAAPGPFGDAHAGISDRIETIAPPPANPSEDDPLIMVDNRYSYCRIFDQAQVEYYPRLSPDGQGILNAKFAPLPGEPYLPNNNPPLYPIDAVTSFIPDEREIVNVTYKLTTTYEVGGLESSESVIITHPVSQKEMSISDKLRGTMEKSYYGNGYIHQGLYPPNTPRVYNDVGRLIDGRSLNEPFDIKQITRKTYPYDKNTGNWRPYPER